MPTDLSVTTDDGVTSVVPGNSDTYTITVTNNGPDTVSSLTLTDAIPSALQNPAFGTPSQGSYDPISGLWSGLSLASGQSVSITLSGVINPSATGTISNIATVSGVTDPNPANNSSTDTDTLTPQADLAITNTDGVVTVVPGGSTTYTIVVSNTGPSTAIAAAVTDPLPAGVTAANWTAVASPGSSVAAATGIGNINTAVTLLPFGTATYTVVALVSPSAAGSRPTPRTLSHSVSRHHSSRF